jgi:putative oxidoreductase
MLKFLERLMPLGTLALRVVLGIIMIFHGYPKLFGGHMQAFLGFMHSIGVPTWLAYISAGAEFFGGVLLVIGLVTRVAALAILIDMLVAIFKVHLRNGLVGQGGYEFPLSLAAIAFFLIWSGAGALSLDYLAGGKH